MFHLEPLIWTVRADEEFKVFGDPYNWVCTVMKTGPTSCRIHGGLARKDIPRSKEVRYARALVEHLKQLGFETITWERASDIKDDEDAK